MDFESILRDALKAYDSRIDTVKITQSLSSYAYVITVKYKKPYDHITICETINVNTLEMISGQLNTYHPFFETLSYNIHHKFNDTLVEQSYKLVEEEEKKQAQQITVSNLSDGWEDILDSNAKEMFKKFEKYTSQKYDEYYIAANEFYKNIDFESAESGVVKPAKVIKKLLQVNQPPLTQVSKNKFVGTVVKFEIAKYFPGATEKVNCPICGPSARFSVIDMIVHLNDSPHNKPRETYIADWLESLSVNLEIKEAI